MWLLCYAVQHRWEKIKTGRKIKKKKKKTVSTTKREEERGGATAECRGECQSGRVAMVVPEAAEGVLAALRAPEPSTPCAPKT